MMKQQVVYIQQSAPQNNALQNRIDKCATTNNKIQGSNIGENSMLKFSIDGLAKFEDNVFYKKESHDKDWNACLYSDELPKGLNVINFTIQEINEDDLSGLAFGVVRKDFGPETKLSIMKKKGTGINAAGFK